MEVEVVIEEAGQVIEDHLSYLIRNLQRREQLRRQQRSLRILTRKNLDPPVHFVCFVLLVKIVYTICIFVLFCTKASNMFEIYIIFGLVTEHIKVTQTKTW